MRYLRELSWLLACLAALACSQPGDEPTDVEAEETGPLSVYVVNYPLRYLAERIGGEAASVVFPAPPGVDPAYWTPDAETVAAYQGADLIILNGAGYARWVELASLPRGRTVDTSAPFRDRLIPLEEAVTHQHGPTGAHSHEGLAFTTWLDPTLALEQARAIAKAFSQAQPEHEPGFRANLARLEADLGALDARLEAAAASLRDAPLLFSHPVYQYLVRRYSLNARSVHFEPDELPDASAWRALRALLEQHPARWMLWEAAPAPEIARTLGKLGVASGLFNPCGNVPNEGDLLTTMQRNAAELEAVAREVATAPTP